MKKSYLLILFLFLSFPIFSQITLRVDQIPSNTPAQDDIYVAGSFNGWSPGSDMLQKDSNNVYWFTIASGSGVVEYKFTRGTWGDVEGNTNGGFLPNRTYTFGNGDTLDLQILSWEDIGGTNSTAAANVSILNNAFFIPQLNRNRRIWIYLPPDYDSSQKEYPVLYMHDGQNLFDDATSFSGEWKVDETLNQLHQSGDYGVIVIGIDNGGADRINEYSPWVNPMYGGGEGDQYLDFITKTLKPHIDSTYRTLSDREFTGIMGSSMGGLISHYAGIKYTDYFGKVGVFSPSFAIFDSAFVALTEIGKQKDGKFYFLAGAQESSTMVPYMQEMYDSMQAKGFLPNELSYLVENDGTHSEWFWAREFGDAYEWLFGDLVLDIEHYSDDFIQIFPNPFSDYLDLEIHEPVNLSFFNLEGKLVKNLSLTDSATVKMEYLPKGTYLLKIENKNHSVFKKLIKIE